MVNIKAGQVALLKTTEEPLFVLAIENLDKVYSGLSGSVAIVRRPIQGTEGVTHSIERFFIEELETLDEKHTRQVSEMEELKARFSTHETLPSQGELFQSN